MSHIRSCAFRLTTSLYQKSGWRSMARSNSPFRLYLNSKNKIVPDTMDSRKLTSPAPVSSFIRVIFPLLARLVLSISQMSLKICHVLRVTQ
jgi:hypothetical protein